MNNTKISFDKKTGNCSSDLDKEKIESLYNSLPKVEITV
jgi:hypothetical protein